MNSEERDEMKAIKLSLLEETTACTPTPLAWGARSRRVKNLNIGDMRADPTVSPQPDGIGGDGRVEAGGIAPGTPRMTLLVTHLNRRVTSYPLHLEPHRMKHQRTPKSHRWISYRLLLRM